MALFWMKLHTCDIASLNGCSKPVAEFCRHEHICLLLGYHVIGMDKIEPHDLFECHLSDVLLELDFRPPHVWNALAVPNVFRFELLYSPRYESKAESVAFFAVVE